MKARKHHSLPTAVQYLTERGLIHTHTRGDWISVRCPVHNGGNERRPSLRVNALDGHFRCMTCGVRGASIFALRSLFNNSDRQKAACKQTRTRR